MHLVSLKIDRIGKASMIISKLIVFRVLNIVETAYLIDLTVKASAIRHFFNRPDFSPKYTILFF